jgi:hypothetical protein
MANPKRRDLGKEKYWRALVTEHAASGETVKGFCLRKHLSEHSFFAWRREIRLRDEEKESKGKAFAGREKTPFKELEKSFVPVRLVSTAETPVPVKSAPIQIETPNGFKVIVEGLVDLKFLGQILAVLQKPC